VRTLAFLLPIAAPTAIAAPVPKELRTGTPLVGTWEIVGMNISGRENADAHGNRWKFLADGSFSNPSYPTGSYAVVPGGFDIHFGQDPKPYHALTSLGDGALKIAFGHSRDVRAVDFDPLNNNVVYTFRRVKE
jgi:hypothetical protein